MNKTPVFKANSELARRIDSDEIKNGGRVSSAAFLPNPGASHLSVNSLEIETLDSIANYYSQVFSESEVFICTRKVIEFKYSTRHTTIRIFYDRQNKKWKFEYQNQISEAFKHRPRNTPPPKSISHCGIEFINDFVNYKDIKKIARRLSGKKPHLFRVKP